MNVFGKGHEWVKAPLSGTMILVCYAGAFLCAYLKDLHGVLLWLILQELVEARRNKYLEDLDA